jgi:hypothetical protein
MIMTMPKGNSETAQYLSKASQSKEQYFHQTATLSKQTAYDELVGVWEECKVANWDGYNAFSVKEKTFWNTLFFIEVLPLGCPLPSVGAEPDGHLTLEWYINPRQTLSISISPEGILYYAALFGNESVPGSENFSGEISKTLLDLINKVHIAAL